VVERDRARGLYIELGATLYEPSASITPRAISPTVLSLLIAVCHFNLVQLTSITGPVGGQSPCQRPSDPGQSIGRPSRARSGTRAVSTPRSRHGERVPLASTSRRAAGRKGYNLGDGSQRSVALRGSPRSRRRRSPTRPDPTRLDSTRLTWCVDAGWLTFGWVVGGERPLLWFSRPSSGSRLRLLAADSSLLRRTNCIRTTRRGKARWSTGSRVGSGRVGRRTHTHTHMRYTCADLTTESCASNEAPSRYLWLRRKDDGRTDRQTDWGGWKVFLGWQWYFSHPLSHDIYIYIYICVYTRLRSAISSRMDTRRKKPEVIIIEK